TSISIKVNADWERVFIGTNDVWFLENTDYQKSALAGKLFFFKRHGRQGWQVDIKGVLAALPWLIRSGNPAQIPHVAATVGFGVGVNDLAIKTGPRNADVILITHYRRGIYDENDHLAFARFPEPSDHAVFGIVKINPLESFVGVVQVPQRRLAFIQVIKMLDQTAYSIVQRRLQKPPVQ